MLLLEDLLSAPASSRYKGNKIISVSDDESNTALITPSALPIDKKERKSTITVSTKLPSNLRYIVPSFALEVNEARRKTGLKLKVGENIQSPDKPK